MLTKEALVALLEQQAIIAADTAIASAFAKSDGLVALPDHFKLHDIEAMMPGRRRARGAMHTPLLADFAEYVKANKVQGSAVFVNPDRMQAVAVLNLGTVYAPGHADDLAVLAEDMTAEYKALLAIADGRGRAQRDIAEFLEDWEPHITCRDGETMLPTVRAIAAVRRMTIEALRKQETAEQSLSAEQSTFESIAATSKEPLPTFITFTCGAYAGLAPRAFVMRMGVGTGGDKPMLQLRIINHELHKQEMARELAQNVREVLGHVLPVAVGGYQANV